MKKKIFTALMTGVFALSLAGCKEKEKPVDPDNPGEKIPTGLDNNKTALRLSTQELDGVFNPFFATSGPDSSMVSMTQIGMINNDKEGKPVYGEDEPTVVLDYATTTSGSESNDTLQTTYYFVLKNNIKFSNGSPLTMKDVLFNLYVYLDPAYTGSSTIYSTEIVGLQEYRTQQDSENEQDSFMKQFTIEAETRIEDLVSSFNEIKEENDGITLTEANLKTLLQQKTDEFSGENRQHLVEDYEKTLALIKDELKTDFTNNKDSYQDISFKPDGSTEVIKPFTTDVETFLYTEGYISYDKKNNELSCSFGDLEDVKTWSEEKAIEMVYADLIPYKLDEVVLYWSKTSTELYQTLTQEAMQNYFQNDETGRKYRNISGIQFANRKAPVTVNGKKYEVPAYEGDGAVKDGSNEVLSITIKGVDPKAIWNFSFSVAPMYYYSDQDHINKFDYESNFGVEYGSIDFMTDVIKETSKLGVPMGAGAYQACNSDGSTDNVTAGEFKKDNIVSFARNDNFIMGAPKIKYIHYQVIPQNNMMNSLDSNGVDFIEPNAKPEIIEELRGKADKGIGFESVQTSGYGYIGINAGKVPNIKVRQIIMHCIDTQECVSYYGTTASAIYRPMSLSSWAYPTGATAYYPYLNGPIPADLNVVNPDYADYVIGLGKKAGERLTRQEQEKFVSDILTAAGYAINASTGVYAKGTDKLQYTFTIAGNETDHPAYNAMVKAEELLDSLGFDITVKTDANALRKLSKGELTVWAAAWSSTIDPDMYQVYHKDSKAGSTTNWGYREILQNNGGKYNVENDIITRLSDEIDAGRHTNKEAERKVIYKRALDLVMELAVELPTYQRDDLFAFNVDRIDRSSLTPKEDLTSFNGLMSKNWLVSYNEYK